MLWTRNQDIAHRVLEKHTAGARFVAGVGSLTDLFHASTAFVREGIMHDPEHYNWHRCRDLEFREGGSLFVMILGVENLMADNLRNDLIVLDKS